MDPISHIALGRTLASLDTRKRLRAGGATACILGALCPDLDIARTLQGWDVYLVHHQSGTHSLAGAVCCGLLTGTVVRLFARRGRWLLLVGAAAIGALSHVLLDLIAGADIKLFAPVWNHAFSVPLFAMADPWLLGVLLIAAVVTWRGTPEGLRHSSFRAGVRTRVAIGVSLLTAVVAAKGLVYARAATIEHAAASRGSSTHVEAVFASWTRWRFIEAHPATLEWWDVDVRAGAAFRAGLVARGLGAPFVQQSRALPTVANLLISHDDTFARVIPAPKGGNEVRWSALRYCRLDQPGSDPVCGVWFGGEYDARGRATAAVMRVGSLVQRRTPDGVPPDDE